MDLFQIIGKEIIDVKYLYINENDNGLQEFQSFFRLSNDVIFQIPYFPDVTINENKMNFNFFSELKRIQPKVLEKIKNYKVLDFHFLFYENELDEQEKAFMELENGVFISEQSYGPLGITTVDLLIFTRMEFEKHKQSLEEGFKIKSFQE